MNNLSANKVCDQESQVQVPPCKVGNKSKCRQFHEWLVLKDTEEELNCNSLHGCCRTYWTFVVVIIAVGWCPFTILILPIILTR